MDDEVAVLQAGIECPHPRRETIFCCCDAPSDRIEMRLMSWCAMNTLIDDETRIYLRDCYDHTVQLLDLLDIYREIARMSAIITCRSSATA